MVVYTSQSIKAMVMKLNEKVDNLYNRAIHLWNIMTREPVPLIIVKGVSKSFSGIKVLNNINTTIYAGKPLGLIGKSGAGKSVFIHMLRGSRDYFPDEGQVIFRVNYCEACNRAELPYEGQPCSVCGNETVLKEVDFWSLDERDPIRMAIRNRIAIMLQRTFALYGDKTVIENIFEALEEGLGENEKINKAIELLDLVNMTHRTTHIARDLSGGEKQRVVLARQLAKDPMILLADEPTGTLDPQTAELVHDALIKTVKDKDMAMVVTSHWPEAIEKLTDEAIWLDGGTIKAIGNPPDIVEGFMQEYDVMRSEEIEVGQPIIRLKNVKKYFFSVVRGVVKAVDGVDLEINEKEIFALVGLSGAGKTTTSRMIAGITPPTDGLVEIRIGDEFVDMSVSGEGGKGRATPYIGILHQEYTLYPFDTILRNLTTCIGMKMPAELAKIKAIQVLRSAGFSDKDMERILYSYPEQLSTGEKQRVAFAQVLIKEPRIIILDEPTGTMDPITKMSVAQAVIDSRRDLGETFVVVSHDMDFVLNCCDRAALMEMGKVVTIGTPEEIVGYLTEHGKLEEFKNGGSS
ncbi:MAG: methyl coenzyme reductase system, component [Candidatus Methanomethylophilaceae archaeon]|nr:methyl coenzyme reductase system, component [Candidatus Methanomethylophilaceae archaeon]